MASGIYKIVNASNGKYYIGSTVNLKRREKEHFQNLRNGCHINVILQRAFNKYSESSFTFVVLEECDADDLMTAEQRFLDEHYHTGVLYNVSRFAHGGDNTSYHPNNEEIRQKISIAAKAMWSRRSEQEKQAWIERRMGEGNGNYGKRWPKERREHLSRLKCGVNNNPITGRTFEEFYGEDEAARRRQMLKESASRRTGKANSFFGRQHSEETRRRLREKHSGMQKNPSNIRRVSINGCTYRCLSDAAKALNVCNATICYRIKSRNPLYQSYIYADEGGY
jgi:group I intron endonuclease